MQLLFKRRYDTRILLRLLVVGLLAAPAAAQWTQWGGPERDFHAVGSAELADKWPEDGPHKVWSRDIDYAHSTILVDEGRVYTMCRRGDQDVVLALDADTGETVWETAYDAPTYPDMSLEFGPGPHSTPMIAGDRIFSIGAMAHLNCLDKKTGKILWSHDLVKELNASYQLRGFASSPIAYQDLVIVTSGPSRGVKDGAGVVAYKQDSGELAWKSEIMAAGPPSPFIVNFGGRDILIGALGTTRFVLDPATGETLCKMDVDLQSYAIMASPLWIPPDLILCSAAYGGGTRLLRLSVDDEGKYALEEVWHTLKMKIHHANAICVGDTIYGSTGSFGPAFMMALNLEDGKPLWRERGFAKATLVLADGKLVILEENGMLTLANPSREGLEVLSKAKLLQEKSWTAPTMVGSRLYLRDHHTIMCLDLSKKANS